LKNEVLERFSTFYLSPSGSIRSVWQGVRIDTVTFHETAFSCRHEICLFICSYIVCLFKFAVCETAFGYCDTPFCFVSGGDKGRGTLDLLLSTTYSRSQMYLSQQLAQLHPELTMPMFSGKFTVRNWWIFLIANVYWSYVAASENSVG
jgi:hypothetical protein